jgi:dihydrofolate synthase/folylpolyglutamate synthase
MEQVGDILLDGAHNPEGAQALASALGAVGGSWHGVFGMLKDKDVAAVLAALAPTVSSMELLRPASPRALEPEQVLPLARSMGIDAVISPGIEGALESARQRARASSGKIVVCGSLYLIGEVRAYLTHHG